MLPFRVVPFNLISIVLLTFCVGGTVAEDCSIRKTSSKLFCYYSKATDVNSCQCTHVVLPVDADVKTIAAVRSRLTHVKVLLTVNSFSESLVTLLNVTHVDGLDLRLTKLTSKNDIQDFISTIRAKLNPKLILALSTPARPELLAKYYDFKALSKHVDCFILETAFLGASGNVTFHPSRLSGVWDVQNTDSVVDLVTGLGAPLQKLVIAAPVQAFKFKLQDAEHTAPGSPALELSTISRKELCDLMSKDKWMLERDQDQAGPYIFRDTTWIAFEDPTSIDIKSKYSRVRGLAGLALKDLSQDSRCSHDLVSLESVSILEAAHAGLSKQARAPRGAVLQSLEREILDAGGGMERLLDSVQVSPYRITRVVDTEGKVHAIRQDTRTEFECSRQGYFVHPRSCGRFYRCVKFDQLTDEYSVFEFDCPAGLVFDARVEVCVWPGSLPQASACSGSSEIAPVPRERFICPGETGYYTDPENCRWFFACLDHGKSPLSAYEFRCPFGLVFDQDRLLCEWPWLVPKCSSGFAEGTYEEYSYGGIGTGALAGSGYETTEDNGLSKTGLVLGQYNGLGSLNSVALGGLSGTLVQPVAKTYSSFNSGRDVDIHGNVLDYKPIGTTVFGHRHQARLNDFADDSHLLNARVNLYKIEDHQQNKDSDLKIDVRLGNFAAGSHVQLVNINQQHVQDGLHQSNFDSLKLVTSNPTSLPGGATSYSNVNLSGGDRINIIGGGFSAVSPGVELSQHGTNIGHVEHATSLPIEGSSTIATVTNVPVPFVQSTVGSVSDFDIYKGGVIANVPNLQYKISPGAFNNLFNQQGYSTANSFNNQSLISFKGFVSATTPVVPVAFVSSTPISLDQIKFGRYNYRKPAVSFVEGSSIAPPVIQVPKLEGYAYPNPSISFVETRPAVIETKDYLPPVTVTTVQPPVVVTKDYLPAVSVIQTPVISPPRPIQSVSGKSYSYSHQNQVHTNVERPVVQIQQSIGYEIPQVQLQKQPQVVQNYNKVYNAYNYGYQQPTIIKAEGYSYPKPTIKFEDIPKINQVFSYYQQVQQPIVQGYSYPKPTIAFEERPSAVSSQSFIKHNTFIKPLERTKIVQHLVPVAPKVVVPENVAYDYPRPAVQFVEEPKPVLKFQHKQQAISSQSFTQHVQQQPQIQIGYEYPKPQIKFEEKPLINQYIPSKVEVPIIQQGYDYPKPSIKFEEKPFLQTQYIQPVVPKLKEQTYIYQAPQVIQYVNPLLSKVQPVITYKEEPLQTAVSSQSYIQHHTFVKPLETKVFEPIVSVKPQVIQPVNYGYAYPKPAIRLVEKPVVVQQTYVTPQRQTVVHVQQESMGYAYPKPSIKFEEKPVQFVTPRPIVQPVVHVQENIGYAYPKPTIKFEQKPVVVQQQTTYVKPFVQPAVIQQTFVTPRPVVQPVVHVQENIGYSYKRPLVKFEEKPAVIQQTFVTPRPVVQPVVHVLENIGYSYPRPSVEFEEKPAVIQQTFVTPRPVVQPVVHVQENIGYSYKRPLVNFEEKPAVIQQTFVTPRPLVQPVVHVQENIGYSYPRPSVEFEEKPAVIQQTFVTPRPVVQPVVHVQESIGYSYKRPLVKFEEKPAVIQQHLVTPRPVVQPVVHVQENIGYSYPRPSVKFEEKPAVIQQTFVIPRPVVQPVVHVQENIGYSYRRPLVKFEEQPAVIQQHLVTPRPVVQPVVHVQENIGYSYPRPLVKFEEKPAVIQQTYVIPRPVVQPVVQVQENIGYSYPIPEQKPIVINQQTSYIKPVQPVVHLQQNIGYEYPKPTIRFEERPVHYVTPKPIVHVQQNIGYEYPKPTIKFEQKPAVIQETFVTPRPVVQVQENIGYAYPNPSIKFEQKPVVIQHQTTYVKPVVQQTYVKPVQPVSTYSFTSLAAKQYIPPVIQQQNIGYTYPKPAIKFEEKPVNYNTYTYQNIEHKQQPVVYEAKPIKPAILPTYTYQQPRPFHVEQPVLSQTYHYQQKPVVKEAIQVDYEYPKPQIKFEETPVITYENRQPIHEEIIVPKKAYVTGYQQQKGEGYVYNKPSIAFEEVRYEAPRVTPRPTYVSTVASVVVPKIQQQNFYSYDSRFESRPQQIVVQPIVEQQKAVVESKPIFKYEFSSLDNSFNSYVAPPQKEYLPQVVSTTERYVEPIVPVTYSAPRLKPVLVQQYSTPKIQIIEEQKTYVQSKPIARYEFSSFDKEYKTYIAPPVIQKEYPPIQFTPKYIVQNIEVKQSKPIVQYEFNSFDSRFEPQKEIVQIKSARPRFQIHVPELEYLPVRKIVTQPPKVYLPVSTTERIQPSKVYLPTSTTGRVIVRTRKPITTTERVITIPNKTYLPVIISTTENIPVSKLDRGYLPVKTGRFIENYEAEQYENSEVVSRRPVKVVKIVRPKSKSIVKVNDFHPILSTKLGAQCTCTSNTLNLRKDAKKITVQFQEPETRISDLEEYINDEDENGDIIIEDYQYEPQKVQDQEISVTRSPDVIVKSTTEELYSNAPAPNLVIKKRVRVRPIPTTAAYEELPVSKASDIFIRRSSRPRTKQIVIVDDSDESNNEEIADAVKTGLNLVKSAVKEGVKEGIRQSNIESKTFDRYGPGGVRSRSETLQGAIDCQRAGLFRHPTHCNKFYACRWDCKKNRFTLHVFNCPVHLTFDNNLGACNWPSQGPACVDNTLLPME